jgi:hypothetical protein
MSILVLCFLISAPHALYRVSLPARLWPGKLKGEGENKLEILTNQVNYIQISNI